MPSQHISLSDAEIIKEIAKRDRESRPVLSLIVIGHVDAGKSTLMGKLLHELGETSDRTMQGQQRSSQKAGKSSFAYAWTFDALPEERERGVTIDIAIDSFSTRHRQFTLIDAPGHRDFIPNMISGATQADTALLVIDASSNAFESGFGPNGQTREHAILVRSLGVRQIVVAVNKLDQVGWAQSRFEGIQEQLSLFLDTAGFSTALVHFVPCAAMSGDNVFRRSDAVESSWYSGPTLLELLDQLAVPPRAVESPLRFPIGNVFKGIASGPSGLGVAGRIENGILQVGKRVAVLPGDEKAVLKTLEVDSERVPWAAAGQYVTAYLTDIDPIYVSPGCILCPIDSLCPTATSFQAQLMIFDVEFPITAGASVELFHHSRNVPAIISQLEAILDRATGEVKRKKPRMLPSGTSARVTIQLKSASQGVPIVALPLEPFSVNKNMGRILLRRGTQTIAAGIVLRLDS